MGYVPLAATSPGDGSFPTSVLSSLFNTGGAGVAPVLLRRGPTAGSPAQAQMAQETGGAGTQSEKSVNEVMAEFGALPDSSLIGLQKKLYNGGFYSAAFYAKHPRTPDYGVKDVETLAAYGGAVNLAAQLRSSNMTLDEIMTQGAAGAGNVGGAGAGGGRTRAPLNVQLTNPTDITNVVNKTVQQLVGRNATQSEIASITKDFQQAEKAAQTAAYNTNIGGGTATQAPNLSAFAEQQVKAEAPNEVAGHAVGANFDSLLAMLKSPV